MDHCIWEISTTQSFCSYFLPHLSLSHTKLRSVNQKVGSTYLTPLHEQDVTQGQFFKQFNRSEFGFPSRLVAIQKLPQSAPYYLCIAGERIVGCITFPMGNVNSLIQVLNSDCCVYFLQWSPWVHKKINKDLGSLVFSVGSGGWLVRISEVVPFTEKIGINLYPLLNFSPFNTWVSHVRKKTWKIKLTCVTFGNLKKIFILFIFFF